MLIRFSCVLIQSSKWYSFNYFFFLRKWLSLNVSIQNGTWMHVAVVLQKISPFLSVFLNGKSKPTPNNVFLTEVEMASAFEDIYIILNSRIDSGESLSLLLLVFIKMWGFFLKKITFTAYIEYCIKCSF